MLNVGTPDRIIRLIAGLILFALPFLINPTAWLSWGLFVVGGILVATAVFGFCPIYAALRISTRRKTT